MCRLSGTGRSDSGQLWNNNEITYHNSYTFSAQLASITNLVSEPGIAIAWRASDERGGGRGGGRLLLSLRGGRGGATALSVREMGIPSSSWTGRTTVIQEESDTELN